MNRNSGVIATALIAARCSPAPNLDDGRAWATKAAVRAALHNTRSPHCIFVSDRATRKVTRAARVRAA